MNFLKKFKYNSIKYCNNIALQYLDNKYSYKELDELSNYICSLLQENNIKPGEIIGIMMPRSEKILISILGILKCGCTFLPIDIDFPKDRINYIIKNSKIKNIITSGVNINFDNVNPIVINDIDRVKEINIVEPIYSYVIYTSGTTGYPKGVLLKYESLNNLLDSFIKILKIKSYDNFLAITTISFDISILELLLPLCVGATVVVAPTRCQIDPYYLSKYIERYKITFMQATPITWKMLIDIDWKNENNIKILCGGEALTEKLADSLIKISDCIWNVYGPTETTIWSSCCRIRKNRNISIGKPINNTIFKIINNDSESDIGELYIGGTGLAYGYLNNEELTNEKFIYIEGERFYKTGDIVKRVNNKYYYVCRSDFQVKINGHRIELLEIENNISKLYNVINNVVIYDDVSNSLICFLISDIDIDDNYIINNLLKKIPNYMIPSKFIKVKEFPLTNNKKIDRKEILKLYKDNYYDNKNYNNNFSSYDIIKMMIELNDTELKTNIEKKYPYDNHEVWFMQSLMYKHKLLYTNSNSFYEQLELNLSKYDVNHISDVLNDLKDNLDLFKISIKRNKNKYIFSTIKNDLFNIIQKNKKLIIKYHNSIIDGESIRIFIKILIDKLNNKEINYDLYNNFINDIELLDNKLINDDKNYKIKKIFVRKNGNKKINESFEIPIKNIKKISKKYSVNDSCIIQYILCKSLFYFSKNNIKFGIVNSNRNFIKSLSIGNFINIVHQEYNITDLKDFYTFTKKYISNKKNYYNKYNENTDYEILLIINNINSFNNILSENNVIIKINSIYENNNSPINIKCNIDENKINFYISAKNIYYINKYKKFINILKENLKSI